MKKHPSIFLYEYLDKRTLYNAHGMGIHSTSDFHSKHLEKLKKKKAKHLRQDTKTILYPS
jgi:hypothetical protein